MRFPAVVIAALLTLAPSTSAAVKPLQPQSVQTQARQKLESQLVQEINALRRSRGLKPLTVSTKLAAAAAQHTREMGVDGYFEHESADGSAFWKRIERWYPSGKWSLWSVGENLVYESPDITADQSIDDWMHSPPHRANLLSKTWREIGVSALHFEDAPGEYEDSPVTIVTADFGYRR